MRVSPEFVGVVHFVGIGGIGMSGIAAILSASGYQVCGSDLSENSNTKRLRALGIKVFIGHKADQVEGSSVVVVSSAIKFNNPELMAARALKIPVVRRAEMLAEIMRLKPSIAVAGSHGKTTTTSLLAHLLDASGWDPTVVSGGIINSFGTNARLGAGKWIVAEADESDGSFNKLPVTVAIVTSIDSEHIDFYGSYNELWKSFLTFVESIPFYGLGILCWDHAEVQKLVRAVTDRRVVTYGFSEGSEIRIINLQTSGEVSTFDLEISGRAIELKGLKDHEKTRLTDFSLPMVGEHNIQNAVAAYAAAFELGIQPSALFQGLSQFKGVNRRFTNVGVVNGVTIIDDYAHHPTEIAKALDTACIQCKGRIIAIVQPHRYSRLHTLFDAFSKCFDNANIVIVTPVYAAGEAPIEGVDHYQLASRISNNGHDNVQTVDNIEELVNLLDGLVRAGDYVVCLGAGSITEWAQDLPEMLRGNLEVSKYGT